VKDDLDEAGPSDRGAMQSFLRLIWDVTSSPARTLRLAALLWGAALLLVLLGVFAAFAVSKLGTGAKVDSINWAVFFGVIAGSVVTVIVMVEGRRVLHKSIRRERANEAERLSAERRFLDSMARLEKAATENVSDRVGESVDTIPLGIILRELEDLGVWSHDDVVDFQQLLRARTSLVHDRDIISLSTLQSQTARAERLMETFSPPSCRRRKDMRI
jgi:hypothetical protein